MEWSDADICIIAVIRKKLLNVTEVFEKMMEVVLIFECYNTKLFVS